MKARALKLWAARTSKLRTGYKSVGSDDVEAQPPASGIELPAWQQDGAPAHAPVQQVSRPYQLTLLLEICLQPNEGGARAARQTKLCTALACCGDWLQSSWRTLHP